MLKDEEILKSIGSIYKFIFDNEPVHRNILRKKLLAKGKIASKEKFYAAVEALLSLGKIIIAKENFYINPEIVDVGILQKKGDNFFVVASNSSEHIDIDKSVASGYRDGEIIDVIVESLGEVKNAVILGKSQRQYIAKENTKEFTKKTDHNGKEKSVLGRVIKTNHDNLVFIPNKKNFPVRQIPILNNKDEYISFQDKICVMNLRNVDSPALGGHIKEVKGNAGNPIHEYDAIAENYGAIMNWDGALLEKEIARIPQRVNVNDLTLITEEDAKYGQKNSVVDLRHIPFVTVDPATCKDMDDAIYSTINQNGDVVCYVAVANVTKYVNINSSIGEKYIKGGFTVYAPNKAYSILPSKLSTGICSLNPNEERLAFVVKTVIDKRTGIVKSYNIYDALIESKKKYSYEEAQAIVDNLEPSYTKGYLIGKSLRGEEFTLDEQIIMNYYAGHLLNKGLEDRKMIRFIAGGEKQAVFNEDYTDILDIKEVPHLYYHEVIEAFMVIANEATAKFANDNGIYNIYRTHHAPNLRKIDKAAELFGILGIDFDGDVSAEGMRKLIAKIKDTPSEDIVNRFLIKMQSRAEYSNQLFSDKNEESEFVSGKKISHYALQSPHYSHTTSPIRRVPDYVTHFNILAHIHGSKPIEADKVKEIIEIANERQIKVDQAERDFQDVNAAIYCEKHIGDVLTGRIVKFRETTIEDGLNDDILAIVKNEDKGVCAEIPISQILGAYGYDCKISPQGCAVYDNKGRPLLTICQPVDFIIEKADRRSMRITGKTNSVLVRKAELRAEMELKRRLQETNSSQVNNQTIKKDNQNYNNEMINE